VSGGQLFFWCWSVVEQWWQVEQDKWQQQLPRQPPLPIATLSMLGACWPVPPDTHLFAHPPPPSLPPRMEAKLRAMESRLRLGGEDDDAAVGTADPRAALEVETVNFHFKEGLPTAADFNKTLEASKSAASSSEAEAAVAALNGGGPVNGH